MKFASQLTMVAMVIATGRASCMNSSATINQGIAPREHGEKLMAKKQLIIPPKICSIIIHKLHTM